jgi:hypothetical protein
MSTKVISSLQTRTPNKRKSYVASELDIEVVTQAPTGFEAKLPFLSKVMNLSSDPKDYFMFVTPLLMTQLSNRNGYSFPNLELTRWNPDLKCQAYEGWRYAPMYEEHQSDDITKALGVVADVSMRPIKGFGKNIWKVLALAAIDRTKNAELAEQVEVGEINTYSMGAMADHINCGYCGAREGKCRHLNANSPVTFYELNGKLVYKTVEGISPYEFSVVRDPAYAIAHSDVKLAYTERSTTQARVATTKDQASLSSHHDVVKHMQSLWGV